MTTNELEEYVEVEDNSPSLAEIYKQRKGKEINIDYFLYSCLEQDRTRKATSENANLFNTPILCDDESLKELTPQDALEDIVAWFKSEWPILKMTNPIDVSCLAEYIPGFVLMIHEIETFFKLRNDLDELPKRNTNKDENDDIWKTIDSNLEKFFPKHHNMMTKYLDWRFSKVEKKEIDLSSIPPVGRFTKMHLKMRDNNRPPRGRNDRPRGNDSRPRGNDNRPRGNDRPQNRNGNSSRNNKFNKAPHNNRHDKQKNMEREKEVLIEVDKSIGLLKSSTDQKEAILKPQNSFLRRIQHQHISDAGFTSESTGEGKERAVKILNK